MLLIYGVNLLPSSNSVVTLRTEIGGINFVFPSNNGKQSLSKRATWTLYSVTAKKRFSLAKLNKEKFERSLPYRLNGGGEREWKQWLKHHGRNLRRHNGLHCSDSSKGDQTASCAAVCPAFLYTCPTRRAVCPSCLICFKKSDVVL